MSFAFKPEEKWNAGGGLLQKGNHLTTVLEITAGDLNSSGGASGRPHPMVKVQTGNDDGSIYDNIVISSPQTFGKFTALVLACGLSEADYPQPGVDFDAETGRVSQQYADKLLGRQVITVVRDEPDNRADKIAEAAAAGSPTPMRPEVKGYRLPSQSETGADTRGLPQPGAQAQAAKGAKGRGDIPF